MVSVKGRNALGYGLLGLAAGVLLFPLFYVITVRTETAVRFSYTWMTIYLFVLAAPAIIGAIYGYSRREMPAA